MAIVSNITVNCSLTRFSQDFASPGKVYVSGDGCTYGLAHAAISVIAARGRYRQINLEKVDSSVFLSRQLKIIAQF